jgi:hypothetical protein
MTSIRNPKKPLPPLATETNYEAANFEHFGSKLTGSKAILRLHLKNGTIIDLPSNDEDLKHLLVILCEAFPSTAISRLKQRGLI